MRETDATRFLVDRLQGLGTSIFTEMSALAHQSGAVNLGQGFPDADGPPEVAEAAIAAIRAGHNQYPPGRGIPDLRAAISEHQQRFWRMPVDPDTEVMATTGATEALFATFIALCEPGDEVVMFEPCYDAYLADIAMVGAVARTVTLRAPDYSFDPDELRAAVGPRTRMVLLNSPHNPTGKVFTPAELDMIADVCVEHDLIAVTDEVYEHLVFSDSPAPHVPLATRPGMAERTLTISSAGKTFSFTGWKIGWIMGPAELVRAVEVAKQFVTFVNGAPFQHAIAVGLRLPDSSFSDFAASLEAKRDRLCAGLEAAGFRTLRPAGTYFVTVDISSVGATDGIEFCRELPFRCGVVGVPTQTFYSDPEVGKHLVRFAFCKQEAVLDEAVERLAGWTTA